MGWRSVWSSGISRSGATYTWHPSAGKAWRDVGTANNTRNGLDMPALSEALKYITDPVYVVMLVLIFLQQRQIASFVTIIKDYSSAITELSTLVKIMISKGPS
jgi:hypothetical protein